MPPGPLPDPNARRRNAPTIPTTNLPASGRQGEPPEIPAWVELAQNGSAWWRWAWSTPQACAWGTNVGQEGLVARRAALEDDMAALGQIHELDFSGIENEHHARLVVQAVARLATGRLSLMKEMRELDDRLGLSPKGMAALRWVIVDDKPAEEQPKPPSGVPSLDERRTRLTSAS